MIAFTIKTQAVNKWDSKFENITSQRFPGGVIKGDKFSISRIFELFPFAPFITGVIYSRLRFYREIYHYEFFGGLRCGYSLSLHQM